MTRRQLRCAAAAWIVLLTVISLQPLRLRAIAGGQPLHPVLHFILFGGAALFPLLLSANRAQAWIRALFVLCIGICVEMGQSLLYRHRTEWRDFEADALGVVAAAIVIRTGRLFSRKTPAAQ